MVFKNLDEKSITMSCRKATYLWFNDDLIIYFFQGYPQAYRTKSELVFRNNHVLNLLKIDYDYNNDKFVDNKTFTKMLNEEIRKATIKLDMGKLK